MSRIERKIEGDGSEPIDAAEILAALAGEPGNASGRRQAAVARYLSASDGWREAAASLGGAFATNDEPKEG